jgi:hypothetical protein
LSGQLEPELSDEKLLEFVGRGISAKDKPTSVSGWEVDVEHLDSRESLLKAISAGAPYKIACLACGISEDAFTDWRRKDPEFARAVEKASGKMALRLLGKIEKQADENFSAAAWLLERRFVEVFARPEVQLNLIQQNNTTVNTLPSQEIRGIEAVAEPVRASVRQMFERYKPNHGNGEEEANGSISKAVEEKFANYRSTPGNGTDHSAGSQVLSVDLSGGFARSRNESRSNFSTYSTKRCA